MKTAIGCLLLAAILPLQSFAQTQVQWVNGSPVMPTLDLNELRQHVERLKRSPEYQRDVTAMRSGVRNSALSDLYAQSQRDPNFSLGALNIREMFERFDRVDIVTNNLPLALQADPNRRSDFYVLGGNLAVFNEEFSAGANRSKVMLLIHVMLGAAGYSDDDYQLTMALIGANMQYFNARTGVSEAVSPRLNIQALVSPNANEVMRVRPTDYSRIQRYNPQAPSGTAIVAPRAASGGFTGVGGGGDGSTVEMKFALMGAYQTVVPALPQECQDLWPDFTTYFNAVSHQKIESSDSIRHPDLPSGELTLESPVMIHKIRAGQSYSDTDLAMVQIIMCQYKLKLSPR